MRDEVEGLLRARRDNDVAGRAADAALRAQPGDEVAQTGQPSRRPVLQRDVAPRSVLFSDLATSYRATAFAPVYVVAVPPTHAANTRPNELAKRRRAVLRFFTQPSLEEPQAWDAQWLVLTRSGPVRTIEQDGLQPRYEDNRFVVFRVPPA